jgi:uncharacterized membrane-anchored protein YjiN (DUF445 family)
MLRTTVLVAILGGAQTWAHLRMTPLRGAELRRIKWLATLLLATTFALFIVARAFVHVHPTLGFVAAFAEAATIGGLADRYAVVALFKRPLGLPIPHTAIIQSNQ